MFPFICGVFFLKPLTAEVAKFYIYRYRKGRKEIMQDMDPLRSLRSTLAHFAVKSHSDNYFERSLILMFRNLSSEP